MPQLVILNKPYDVLCQFRDREGRTTLADYVDLPRIYPAGRLDRDSEGLVLLTHDGRLQHQIAHPRFKLWKRYWVQVEGTPDQNALQQLANGVPLSDGVTRPAKVTVIPEPDNLWPRDPPIRFRARIPTTWLSLSIREGRNRQVRRMTAAVGFPTLRLVRYAIGNITITGMAPGSWRIADVAELDLSRAQINRQSPGHKDRHRRPRVSL